MHFIQTDLSNRTGVEVLPQGCDLVIAKDLLNHMVLPDAVNALSRIVATRPRFLLTHLHTNSDNTGWEKRIDKHLHYTRYDYGKPPFSLPYPATLIQRISEDACFVLYEISKEGQQPAPARVERLAVPPLAEPLDEYTTVVDGELIEEVVAEAPAVAVSAPPVPTAPADELGPRPPDRTKLVTPVTELPEQAPDAKAAPERRPIKGIPAVEFRARCDLIFEKFDADHDDVLNFEELCKLMESGGRNIEEYDAYAGLCKKLGVDPRIGLSRKDVYKLFEKAPQAVWEEVYRNINPLAQMVRRGADKLPETFLEKPISEFIFA